MKTYCFLLAGLAGLALFSSGCASSSTPPRPTVVYPVTYDVQVGNTQVNASAGPQNLNVSATQQVTAFTGLPLYYQVNSPVAVSVAIYEKRSPMASGRVLLREMQGTAFTSSVTPSVSTLEFVFSVIQENSSGTLKFTLSDRPIAPATSMP